MKVAINVTKSVSVVKSNVRFIASFFIQEDEFAKAFDAVFKDIQRMSFILSQLGVPDEAVIIKPIRANANWVRVEKKTDNKTKEYETVQKGFVASGSMIIELPLSWADNSHKFSSIYMSINGLETKNNITYEFYADDEAINTANVELRGKLIDAARNKLNELMKNQSTIEFNLSDVIYGDSISNTHSKYSTMNECMSFERKTSNYIEETPVFDADTIDNIISLDFAPKFELTDSISTKWKSVKNNN